MKNNVNDILLDCRILYISIMVLIFHILGKKARYRSLNSLQIQCSVLLGDPEPTEWV
jgi:hypothetical protein